MRKNKQDKIFEKIKEAIVCNIPFINPDDITPNALLTRDLGIDSIDLLSIATDLEEEYGVFVDDDLFEKDFSVGYLAEFIAKRIK